MSLKSLKKLPALLSLAIIAGPSAALAAGGVTPPTIVPSSSASADPKALALKVFNYALWFVGIIALGFLIWGGIQFVMSGGDETKVTKARNTILYAVVGIIVVIISLGIINFLTGFFG
jgi:hypothetical protein